MPEYPSSCSSARLMQRVDVRTGIESALGQSTIHNLPRSSFRASRCISFFPSPFPIGITRTRNFSHRLTRSSVVIFIFCLHVQVNHQQSMHPFDPDTRRVCTGSRFRFFLTLRLDL
ncbi:hypothetical protein PAXRUDRAFT_537865 [Paxillus rubicundulus Ve08.2h10]|uniref:Uncharacterized protein n=1 Tax=Paxillus rubicundulus Ve08.2h10 TaxID=930991 RepID=A0A0D0EAX7_9AGAM|nr:hypothetical protein PAXRUDRAFT_537865 [Paxillus rubicundulus Ve08.2h10]